MLNLPLVVGTYSCAVAEEQNTPPKDLRPSPLKPLSRPHNVTVRCSTGNQLC